MVSEHICSSPSASPWGCRMDKLPPMCPAGSTALLVLPSGICWDAPRAMCSWSGVIRTKLRTLASR